MRGFTPRDVHLHMLHVIILAIVQGFAELLPVSSSAHVIVAEKLMGMDPAAPAMTLLLVMLHTGTMVAVIVYFWQRWRQAFFSSGPVLKNFVVALVIATFLTGIVGGAIIEFTEKVLMGHEAQGAWVEQLFNRLDLIAAALAAAGIFILVAGLAENRRRQPAAAQKLTPAQYSSIGAVQGLCIPFRGFSRSGATISTGLLGGVTRASAEDFSFALAVVLTPPADAREIWRLYQSQHHQLAGVMPAVLPSVVGVICAFLAGLLALKWLSRWLEAGRWHFFGIYCLFAAFIVAYLHHTGF